MVGDNMTPALWARIGAVVGLATSGIKTTGLASNRIATSRLATNGIATSGLAISAIKTTGLVKTGAAAPPPAGQLPAQGSIHEALRPAVPLAFPLALPADQVNPLAGLEGLLSIQAKSPQGLIESRGCVTTFPDQVPRSPWQPLSWVNTNAPKGGRMCLGTGSRFERILPMGLQEGMPGLGFAAATLLYADPEQEGVSYPYVAQEVFIEKTLDGGKVATFVLHPEARFSDGSPITAKDVRASFDHIKTVGLYAAYYKAVQEVLVDSANLRQVRFVLAPGAAQEMPVILGQFPIWPAAFLEKMAVPGTHFQIPPVAGPYSIDNVVPGQRVEYHRVKSWWGQKLPVMQGLYNIDVVSYEVFLDPTVMAEAFKKGEIDVVVENMAKNWAQGYDFPAVRQGRVVKRSFANRAPGYCGILANVRPRPLGDGLSGGHARKGHPLESRLVRKALALLFPFEDMNKTLWFGGYTRVTSAFGMTRAAARDRPSRDEQEVLQALWGSQSNQDQAGLPQGQNPWLVKEMGQSVAQDQPLQGQLPQGQDANLDDVESFSLARLYRVWDQLTPDQRKRQALGLLDQAGCRLKEGKLMFSGKPVRLTILSPSPIFDRVLARWRESLRSVGIDLVVRLVDQAQYGQQMAKRAYDFVFEMVAPSAAFPGSELVGSVTSSVADDPMSDNVIGIKNALVDRLVAKVLEAKTQRQLYGATHCLDRALMAQFYMIGGWVDKERHVAYWRPLCPPSHPMTQGVHLNAWWSDPVRTGLNPSQAP
jgi:microcin C transport system substrate-binding protein